MGLPFVLVNMGPPLGVETNGPSLYKLQRWPTFCDCQHEAHNLQITTWAHPPFCDCEHGTHVYKLQCEPTFRNYNMRPIFRN